MLHHFTNGADVRQLFAGFLQKILSKISEEKGFAVLCVTTPPRGLI
jgi:hypothetical protein